MPKKRPKTNTVRGKVVAHNISPKGHVEGALVETEGGTVQLNFPEHGAAAFARTAKIGAAVDVTAEIEHDDGDHPVFRVLDDDHAVTGAVVRFNYARHGEVNGYHLDDGTFVHVKPKGAKRYKVAVGDHITAEGSWREGDAAKVLEPERVTKTADRGHKS